MFVIDILAVCL